MNMRVVSVHRLPFDEVRFEADYGSVAGHDPDGAFRRQFRENWENAWLVVIEADVGPKEIDFGKFWCGRVRDEDAQAAWEEQIISAEVGRTTAAFYLHHVNRDDLLGYREDEVLAMPEPTPAPPWLWEKVLYVSPD